MKINAERTRHSWTQGQMVVLEVNKNSKTSHRAQIPLLSIDEAAIILGIARSTAYRAIKDGTFPVRVIRLGGRLRISRVALERLLSGDEAT